MKEFQPTERTRVRRIPERAVYEKKAIEEILDAGFLAHVGFVIGGRPYVMPLIYGRQGETLYLHGSAGGRALRALREGSPLCLTVTLLDGLVMARSSFNHSMNYRCVVVLGAARVVAGDAEKIRALKIVSDHLFPGRWEDARRPSDAELKQTSVVALDLVECSAKVRVGPPEDEDADYSLPVWAGVIPLRPSWGKPVDDPRLKKGPKFPRYLAMRFRDSYK